jgi:hypothetical protein
MNLEYSPTLTGNLAASTGDFSEVLVFDNIFGKFLGTHTQAGNLNFTLGVGSILVATIHLIIVSDGVSTISFSDDFDYIYGFDNGTILPEGSYEVYLIYKSNGKVSVNIPNGGGGTSTGASDLIWSATTDMIVTGNSLEATSVNALAQASQTLVGDGYIQFRTDATIADSSGCVIVFGTVTGQSVWDTNEFSIYVFNGDIYSSLFAVSTGHVPIAGGDSIRMYRVGTEMKFYHVVAGVPSLLRTVTGVTTADLFIKASIVDSGSKMYDCILQNT